MVPQASLVDAALDALVTLSHGPVPLRVALAHERLLLPRLVRLVSAPGSQPCLHAVRRAAQVLANLADAPECHSALRPYEWMLVHVAMHDAAASPLVSEVLDLLVER